MVSTITHANAQQDIPEVTVKRVSLLLLFQLLLFFLVYLTFSVRLFTLFFLLFFSFHF